MLAPVPETAPMAAQRVNSCGHPILSFFLPWTLQAHRDSAPVSVEERKRAANEDEFSLGQDWTRVGLDTTAQRDPSDFLLRNKNN